MRSIQKIFVAAKDKPHANPYATVHTLRHNFPTHLSGAGTDSRYIQEILGHSSKTTEIRTHVSMQQIQKIKSPLDDLDL